MPFRPSRFRTTLARSLTDGGSEVEIFLNSLTSRQGHVLTMAEIGSKGYLKINPGSSNEEIVSFTGIDTSGTTPKVTGVVRGYNDYNTSQTAANKKPHSPGAPVIITNDDHYLSEVYMDAESDEVVTGEKTFAALPKVTAGDATDDNQLVRYAQVLAMISGGTYSQNRVVITGNAGETVAAGNLVYLDVADGEWKLADADTAAFVENVNLGIAQGAGTDGNAIAGGILIFGLDTNQTGLTSNTKYYASNTAGGISSSAGTKEVTIGVARSTTTLWFMPRYDQQLTEDQQDAFAGTVGTPGSANPYVTADNINSGDVDQSQATQNGSSEVGEADITTKRNILAQSFTAGVTKVRGVELYKSADTGSFTGTVKVALQADTSGSPSGSDLASVTITNAQWLQIQTGTFRAFFTSEYASLVKGSLYWIVVTPSTSDTSNHPNLGTNTAGGYASGSAKYKNSTDSWVAISTIDLYFKTLQGFESQLGAVIQRRTFAYSDTWTKPTNAKMVKVIVIGGGGSGASGSCRAFSTNNTVGGGGGGGGGSVIIMDIPADLLPSTVAVTVGTYVAGGAAVTPSGTSAVTGNNGTDGNASSFGTYAVANGGKKGLGAAGGGDGGYAKGLGSGVANTSATAINGQGGTGGAAATIGTSSEWGGGGGGGGGNSGGTPPGFGGGSSVFGGGAGGGGGGASTANSGVAGGAGGAGGQTASYTAGGGPAGGAGGTDGSGSAGSPGVRGIYASSGGGGGGGGQTAPTSSVGGVGGAGNVGSGGGGGGAIAGPTGATLTSGVGGQGGRGEVIVITYL